MKRFTKGLVGLILLVILAWLGVWFYAEMRIKQLVEARIEQINSSGSGQLTYAKIITSRSPLVAGVSLTNPQLNMVLTPSSLPVDITAARIGAHVNLFDPLTLHIDFPLKITLGKPGEAGILTFASANVTESLTPSVWRGNTLNPISAGLYDFKGISLFASNGSLEVAQIDSLSLTQTLNAQANTAKTALMLTENLKNLQISPLFARLFGLPFNGKITSLASSLSLSGPLNWEQIAHQEASLQTNDQRHMFLMQTFHQWAKSGGNAQGNLSLQIGPSHMQTDFTLAFDQQVQPKGTANISADHLTEFDDALVAAYPDLQTSISQIEASLAPYTSSTPQGGQVLQLHATYGQDGVFLNGQKTGTEPYLNWNALLSSAPLPVFAPGDGSGAATTVTK